MFRNAIASSSKLTLPRLAPSSSSSSFSTSARAPLEFSPSRRNAKQTIPTLGTLSGMFPDLPPAPTSPSTVRPPRSTSTSTASPSTPRIPSIPSLSSRNTTTAALKFRWDPSPPIDDTPTSHTLTVTSTRNNLLLTLSDRQGPVFPTITGGTGKTFKNAARSGYEAGHQAALKMFEKVLELVEEAPRGRGQQGVKIRLAMKGYAGQGQEAFMQALAGNDGSEVRRVIVRVEDRTGVKIGGTRARKPRRL